MSSEIRDTFMFLTKLAWNSKITLPVLITTVFMALNFRWEVEINIHTERIHVFRDVGNESDAESDNSWETLASEDEDSDIDEILELGRSNSNNFVTSTYV